MNSAWDVVTEFENVLAEYTGAPYVVCVDSCTNALLLCFYRMWREHGSGIIVMPKYTYIGVAQSAINAGHHIQFTGNGWKGEYPIYFQWTDFKYDCVIDSAKRFKKRMYPVKSDNDTCLSFHWQKHLPIGKGGAILTESEERADLYRRMRYDGRTPGVAPKDDTFIRGFHCMMDPKDAAQGLLLMQYIPDYNEDLPCDDYPDLSTQEILK
jgi:dTDP-4-amino-4,6-dideoxygalactose transaminase